MKENEQLIKLYKSKIKVLSSEIEKLNNEVLQGKAKATNPLLIQVDSNYLNADIKIMFFGQETNIWHEKHGNFLYHGNVDSLTRFYSNFFLNKNYKKHKNPFWRGINKLDTEIKKELDNQSVGFVWNNVLKIGRGKIGFPSKINPLTNRYFKVVLDEISILKPDYILYFSGPNYDKLLKYVIGDFSTIQIKGFNTREFCMIKNDSIPLSFRTYHPNYLYLSKKIDSVISGIIKEIKTNTIRRTK